MDPSLIELLSRLVAFDTQNPDGDELPALEFCAELLGRLAPDELVLQGVERRRGGRSTGYVFARFGRPRLLLNGHIDTVPASGEWSGSPFELRRRGERVVGLGASDTKGGIAAILTGLARVAPRDTAVLISGDEEDGNEAMAAFLAARALDEVELAIVTEPSDGLLATEHRGILHYDVSSLGPGGHSSRADELSSPVLELSRAALAVAELATRARAAERGFCLNLTEIRSGAAFNVIPSRATLVFSARPAPGMRTGELAQEIEELLAGISPGLEVSRRAAQPSFLSSGAEPIARWLGAHAPPRVAVPFWTEAALLEERGVSAVVYGPGAIAEAHRADESIEIAALARAADLFERALRAVRG